MNFTHNRAIDEFVDGCLSTKPAKARLKMRGAVFVDELQKAALSYWPEPKHLLHSESAILATARLLILIRDRISCKLTEQLHTIGHATAVQRLLHVFEKADAISGIWASSLARLDRTATSPLPTHVVLQTSLEDQWSDLTDEVDDVLARRRGLRMQHEHKALTATGQSVDKQSGKKLPNGHTTAEGATGITALSTDAELEQLLNKLSLHFPQETAVLLSRVSAVQYRRLAALWQHVSSPLQLARWQVQVVKTESELLRHANCKEVEDSLKQVGDILRSVQSTDSLVKSLGFDEAMTIVAYMQPSSSIVSSIANAISKSFLDIVSVCATELFEPADGSARSSSPAGKWQQNSFYRRTQRGMHFPAPAPPVPQRRHIFRSAAFQLIDRIEAAATWFSPSCLNLELANCNVFLEAKRKALRRLCSGACGLAADTKFIHINDGTCNKLPATPLSPVSGTPVRIGELLASSIDYHLTVLHTAPPDTFPETAEHVLRLAALIDYVCDDPLFAEMYLKFFVMRLTAFPFDSIAAGKLLSGRLSARLKQFEADGVSALRLDDICAGKPCSGSTDTAFPTTLEELEIDVVAAARTCQPKLGNQLVSVLLQRIGSWKELLARGKGTDNRTTERDKDAAAAGEAASTGVVSDGEPNTPPDGEQALTTAMEEHTQAEPAKQDLPENSQAVVDLVAFTAGPSFWTRFEIDKTFSVPEPLASHAQTFTASFASSHRRLLWMHRLSRVTLLHCDSSTEIVATNYEASVLLYFNHIDSSTAGSVQRSLKMQDDLFAKALRKLTGGAQPILERCEVGNDVEGNAGSSMTKTITSNCKIRINTSHLDGKPVFLTPRSKFVNIDAQRQRLLPAIRKAILRIAKQKEEINTYEIVCSVADDLATSFEYVPLAYVRTTLRQLLCEGFLKRDKIHPSCLIHCAD